MDYTALLMSLVEKAAPSFVKELFQRIRGNKIRIDSPQPGQVAQRSVPIEGRKDLAYEVEGTLKRLPDGHRIWLIIEDERQGRFWPQGFFPVRYNQAERKWVGRVNSFGGPDHKVIAVVVPPSISQLFDYYEQAGLKVGEYEPLRAIPAECTNRAYVQAKFPPGSSAA